MKYLLPVFVSVEGMSKGIALATTLEQRAHSGFRQRRETEWRKYVLVLLLCLGLPACGGSPASPAPVVFIGDPITASASPAPVVFIGDSITAFWDLQSSFPAAPYINVGISGQTTVQILDRFDTDVIANHPKIVVIVAGTNDVLRYMSQSAAIHNMRSMIAKAHAAHIRVIVGTLPPVAVDLSGLGPEYAAHDYNRDIVAYNSLLIKLRGTVVDYHAVLTGSDGSPIPGMLRDGVHPTDAGYAVMTSAITPLLIESQERVRKIPLPCQSAGEDESANTRHAAEFTCGLT